MQKKRLFEKLKNFCYNINITKRNKKPTKSNYLKIIKIFVIILI